MSKLGLKIFIRMSLVVVVVFIITFLTNRYLLPTYMVHQHKVHLNKLVDEIEELSVEQVIGQIEQLRQQYDVTIVYTPYLQSENELNGNVKDLLNRQGITLSKFWISSWSMDKLNRHETVMKLYSQQKLSTSFLVAFVNKEDTLFVMGDSIAQAMDPLYIANQFYVYITLGGLGLTIGLSWLIARRIVRPLAKLEETAEHISKLSFQQVRIETGDEIETLADSINKMSVSLKESHQALQDRNDNLKAFISNISHELKTPLSLIKAYAVGMKDGLDDGTYLDVIEQQADEIQHIVDRLLRLSRLQTETYVQEQVDMRQLIKRVLERYRIPLEHYALRFELEDEAEHVIVQGDSDKLDTVLDNLLSNAVSYASGRVIHAELRNKDGMLRIRMMNEVSDETSLDADKLWEPFYVGEQSRNKKRSGTGLGLSIVRAIVQKHGASPHLSLNEGQFIFEMELPLVSKMQDDSHNSHGSP